jgi:hypothetical protein
LNIRDAVPSALRSAVDDRLLLAQVVRVEQGRTEVGDLGVEPGRTLVDAVGPRAEVVLGQLEEESGSGNGGREDVVMVVGDDGEGQLKGDDCEISRVTLIHYC